LWKASSFTEPLSPSFHHPTSGNCYSPTKNFKTQEANRIIDRNPDDDQTGIAELQNLFGRMFNVIKRVISGEDVGEGNEPSESAGEDRIMEDGATPPAANNLQPALVENDADGSGHNRRTTDDAADTGSSLSDVSDTNIEEMDSDPNDNNNYIKMVVDDDGMLERSNAIPEQVAAMFPRGQFPRHDSRASNDSSSGSHRASSQNSSRDWGWFEDVHGSENATSPYLKRKDATDDKHNSKKGKKSGLVPQANVRPSSRSLNEILHSSLGNGRLTSGSTTTCLVFCRPVCRTNNLRRELFAVTSPVLIQPW
jgi:hypothetical protein